MKQVIRILTFCSSWMQAVCAALCVAFVLGMGSVAHAQALISGSFDDTENAMQSIAGTGVGYIIPIMKAGAGVVAAFVIWKWMKRGANKMA